MKSNKKSSDDENSQKTVPIFFIESGKIEMVNKVFKTDDEWKSILEPEQFEVARKKGTELAFTGKYHDCHEDGIYNCVCCGTNLFDSKTKFDSGTGWPSFWEVVSELNVKEKVDKSLFMVRTEVLCSRCDAHLGHVFDDGPAPTYLRYCMNSASLKFIARDKINYPPK